MNIQEKVLVLKQLRKLHGYYVNMPVEFWDKDSDRIIKSLNKEIEKILKTI